MHLCCQARMSDESPLAPDCKVLNGEKMEKQKKQKKKKLRYALYMLFRSIQIRLIKSTSRLLTVVISTGTNIVTDTNSCLRSLHLHLQVLLCSLTGDIFPKEQHSQQQADSSSMRNEHLRQMLQMVWVWVPEPQAAVHQAAANEEAFLLDACRYAHWG